MTSDEKTANSFTIIDQLQITSGLLARYADRIFYSEVGISLSKYIVMAAIDACGSPVNQSRIAERVQRNLNSISMMIDRLSKEGLVTRTRSGADRRENNLSLTSKGKKMVAQGKKVNESINKRLLDLLGEKEARKILEILGNLEKRISPEMDK